MNLYLIDLDGKNLGNFLWDRERLERISRVESNTYQAVGSRHRGALYSDLIESLKRGQFSLENGSQEVFGYPHVL